MIRRKKQTQDSGIIEFLPSGKKAEISKVDSVLAAALQAGIELNHSCEGMGSCTTCRIIVRKGLEKIPRRNEIEQERAEERGYSDEERLACQIKPIDGLVVEVP